MIAGKDIAGNNIAGKDKDRPKGGLVALASTRKAREPHDYEVLCSINDARRH